MLIKAVNDGFVGRAVEKPKIAVLSHGCEAIPATTGVVQILFPSIYLTLLSLKDVKYG